jgi:hypothetical protein
MGFIRSRDKARRLSSFNWHVAVTAVPAAPGPKGIFAVISLTFLWPPSAFRTLRVEIVKRRHFRDGEFHLQKLAAAARISFFCLLEIERIPHNVVAVACAVLEKPT